MTKAHIYELGAKAFLAGQTLAFCPYDAISSSGAHDAWKDGWLDANRANWRAHKFAIVARHARTSLFSAHRLALQRSAVRDALNELRLDGQP
jgi:ribosome modulation factor